MENSHNDRAENLLEALQYVRRIAGHPVIIKVGGELFENKDDVKRLAQDISLLNALGVKVVVVHGGGPQISRAMTQFGITPTFIDGQRVTDEQSLHLMSMIMIGSLSPMLVSALRVEGTKAVGLSGIDDGLIEATPKDLRLGLVGDITKINTQLLHSVLSNGYVPVIAGVGVDNRGQMYNINADTVAGKVATSIGAKKLFLITNVKGIYRSFGDETSFISETDILGLIDLKAHGALSTGMIPKVDAVIGALKGGVEAAHIIDGRISHSILLELSSVTGIGTMVTQGMITQGVKN
jgi:acetylglutamate kinase